MISSRQAKWILFLLAFVIPLGFAFFTSHEWEDYYITLRSSRNLVEGHGLVFNPGERVHTFTSPLGVLIPAVCTWITGPDRELAALWLFRIVSSCCLLASVYLIWQRFDQLKITAPSRLLFFGLLLFDGKLIDFSINGMETALTVFFGMLLWAELERPAAPRVSIFAVAVAGLMWTRPDGFILAGALIIPYLVFSPRTADQRSVPWASLFWGLVVAGIIYVPWFAWAWWYYGSPVPNTIVAKAAYVPAIHLRDILLLPWFAVTGQANINYLYLPTYWMFGSWSPWLIRTGQVLSVIATFAWLVPLNSVTGRRASLTVLLAAFYLCAVPVFPWYVPQWSVVASLAIAFAFEGAYSRAVESNSFRVQTLLRATCGLVILFQASVFFAVAWQMRNFQQIIENNSRRQIGLWLKQNSKAGDSVFLEPLGYIGYYSQLKTYDFPGLSSPEVIAAYRNGITSYAALIEKFQPTWVILRPQEISSPAFQERQVLNDYLLTKTWDVLPLLNQVSFLPGRKWGGFDSSFVLYHRKAKDPGSPANAAIK